MTDPVEWRDVPGSGGTYQVSDTALVRGVARTCLDGRKLRGRDLWQTPNNKGYKQVSLSIGGLSRKFMVHRLVASAFLQHPIPRGMHVCHCDGNPANNVLANLRIDTAAGNMADKIRHGTTNRGTQNTRSKLTAAQVLEILQEPGPLRGVAARYGVDSSTISAIKNGKSWSHVTGIQRTGAVRK